MIIGWFVSLVESLVSSYVMYDCRVRMGKLYGLVESGCASDSVIAEWSRLQQRYHDPLGKNRRRLQRLNESRLGKAKYRAWQKSFKNRYEFESDGKKVKS